MGSRYEVDDAMSEREIVVQRIRELLVDQPRPLIIAIDGRSGTGKSTLAVTVAEKLDALVIDGDDFYAGGTAGAWDAMTPAERSSHCIDWRRQRLVLESLRQGRSASWQPYDWDADDGRVFEQPTVRWSAAVVILEGVYSARPELADLLDLTVLLEIPEPVRLARLSRREGGYFDPLWHERWASAEAWYFEQVMPPEAFDLAFCPRG